MIAAQGDYPPVPLEDVAGKKNLVPKDHPFSNPPGWLGLVSEYNRAACEFHGKPRESLLAEKWAEHYDLYLPDGKTLMRTEENPLFRALHGEECKDVKMKIVPKNAEPLTLLASGQPMIECQGNI